MNGKKIGLLCTIEILNRGGFACGIIDNFPDGLGTYMGHYNNTNSYFMKKIVLIKLNFIMVTIM